MRFAQLFRDAGSKNACTVRLGTAMLYFSYDSLIAVSHPDFGSFRDKHYVNFSKSTSGHATFLGVRGYDVLEPDAFQAKLLTILRHCTPLPEDGA